MNIVVRKFCCLLIGFVAIWLPSAPLDAADKVRISVTNPNMSFLPSAVALKKGFFKDEGLEVEIIRMNVPNIITALVTGDIGYTLIFGSVVRGALRGMPMRALASLLDGSTHALVAKPEYKSAKDLKGKTVGIGNFGGTDEVAGRMMLKSFGLDTEKDLKFIALGPDRARLAALKEGLVDVAVIAPPGDALGKQMGFNVMLRAYEVFSFPFIGIGANLKTIKEKPDEVKKVVKAMVRANRFIREDKESAVRILMEWGKVDRDPAAAAYDSTWTVTFLPTVCAWLWTKPKRNLSSRAMCR